MPVLGGAAKKIMENVRGKFAFSPDGKQIAFVRYFGSDVSSLFIANIDGTNERTLASFEQPIILKSYGASWSPDGKIIACAFLIAGLQNVLAVQVADRTSAPVLPQDWNVVQQTAWLPDSKSLLIIGTKADRVFNSKQIWQISYPGGEARQITNDTNNYDSIALTSDGRFLTTVRNELVEHVWTMPSDDITRARQLTTGFEKSDGVSGLSWMPNGKIVYGSAPSGKGVFRLWKRMEANPNSWLRAVLS